ncbi:MAG TPA: hypothetical protein VFI47_17250 [Acidimicrobiales bacterium]|nr:hypothetical protein [Acidimicrobiales bacterium]
MTADPQVGPEDQVLASEAELDRRLRWIMGHTFSIDDLVACCDADGVRGISSFDELTFGDYQRAFEARDKWAKLGWPLDRAVFVRRLQEIREIRNDVMHFKPDPLPKDAVERLRRLLQLLKEFTR